MTYTNRRQAVDKIAAREPFTGNSISGVKGHEGRGRLSGDDLERWADDREFILYTVYSYATPIAWYTSNQGWYRVKAKFSMTTSHHQGLLYKV